MGSVTWWDLNPTDERKSALPRKIMIPHKGKWFKGLCEHTNIFKKWSFFTYLFDLNVKLMKWLKRQKMA